LKYQEKYPSLLEALRRVYPPSQDQTDTLDDGEFPGILALLKGSAVCDVSSPEDILDYLLQAAIDRFGYSARDVFRAVFNCDSIIGEHQSAFEIEYEGLLTAVSALRSHTISDNAIKVSNWIVTLSPEYQRPFSNVKWSVNFKSKWVARSVLQQLEQGAAHEVCRYMGLLRRLPQAKPMARWFFEPIAHRTIAENSEGGFWTLIKMSSNDHDLPTFKTSITSGIEFSKVKRKVVELRSVADLSTTLENDRYYIPKDSGRGFTLFDSFIVDLDYSHKSAVLWVLQVMKSQSHGGSVQSCREIRTIVRTLKEELWNHPPPHNAPKLTATPRPRVEVRYLLVVSKDGTRDLQWHPPDGWNQGCSKDDHRGDVYCLEIPISVRSTII